MTGAQKAARILITDDERDIRDLITFTQGFAGYQVITANNGEVAYQVALREMPDLILLDVRMPRMTGYQVCRLLNEHQSTRMIPIIFLSVKSQESESNTGLEPGEEYIHKIFSMDELLERIHTIMKGTAP